jgi:hypothetical protein
MAYTDFRGLATILTNGPPINVTLTEAVKVGDLLDKEFGKADASAAQGVARWVALRNGASSAVIPVASWAVLQKPSTIAAGGDVTAGDHSGTLGDTLWLSTTAGAAVEAVDGDGIGQVVGHVISTTDVLLQPETDYDQDIEVETSAKTLDVNDSGKAFYVTGTSNVVITLPATAAQGVYKIVNASQDGDKLTSVSPNASDGIVGNDFSNTDDGDATNTKATSKAGDYIVVESGGLAGGFYTKEIKGIWAGA